MHEKKGLLENLTAIPWDWFVQARTWDFIAIIFLSIGTIFTLFYSFFPKEKYQRISLWFFLIGTFLWIASIVVQSSPLALSEIHKIGWVYVLLSLLGLILALYASWMWIKKNKHLWLIFAIIGISSMVLFVWNKRT